jgi:hypothetical protein
MAAESSLSGILSRTIRDFSNVFLKIEPGPYFAQVPFHNIVRRGDIPL